MDDIITQALAGLGRGEVLAVATIVARQGSTPRTAGSKMLIGRQGGSGPVLLAGTVGGGLLEGMSMDAAARVMASQQPQVIDFDLSGELAAGTDMICGGKLSIFVEPLTAADIPFFEALLEARRNGRSLFSATWLDGGGRWLFGPNDGPNSPACPDAGQLLREVHGLSLATIVCVGVRSCFVEPWPALPQLILAGGGHVALSTAQVAVSAGFGIIVLDDRPEFADSRRFPQAELVRVAPDFVDCFAGLALNERSYIIIVTRGHVHDGVVLEQALATRAGYIGMIGSRRKRDAIYESLRGKGVGEQQLARVHCPIGLPIGAETPEEIAVSIVAECIAHRRKG